MNTLRFLKWPLLFLFAGIFVWFTAMLIKIRYWPSADLLFLIAWLIIANGMLLGIVKLLLLKKNN